MNGKPMSESCDGKASYVIFHDSTGKVFHIHKHVSFSGQHAADDHVESNARELLVSQGRSRENFQVLLVRDLELEPEKRYRVDVAGRKLVTD